MNEEDDGGIPPQQRRQAQDRIERAVQDLAAERIDEEAWHEEISGALTQAYLAAASPSGQSGHSGDAAVWRAARYLNTKALKGDGSFLDIGCANGLLMESVVLWAGESGLAIEPYGLDISAELVDLARRRLPQWAGRIVQGNARFWKPLQPFDYVRTGIEYAPPGRQGELLLHLFEHCVAGGGRLIVGTQRHAYRAEVEGALAAAGLGPVGSAVDSLRCVLWVDKD
ncbi:MAG: SAM-dependent methyltransferase [Candidatus Latescibacteria bacterium]|nr:SAM-dependent methyltransferase [Candidatus Latescibacterota bacterium]